MSFVNNTTSKYSKGLFHDIFQNTSLPMIVFDANGALLEINRAAKRLLPDSSLPAFLQWLATQPPTVQFSAWQDHTLRLEWRVLPPNLRLLELHVQDNQSEAPQTALLERLARDAAHQIDVKRFIRDFATLQTSSLEGRLVALLLLCDAPMSLTQATQALGVSKVSVSKLVNAMLERGDLVVSKEFSTREHKFQLTQRLYLRDLLERRNASSKLAVLIDGLLEHQTDLDEAVQQQLKNHLELHLQVFVWLERLLVPLEQQQQLANQQHLKSSWDAVLPAKIGL